MNKKILTGLLFSTALLTTGCMDSKESFTEDSYVWVKECTIFAADDCDERKKSLSKRQEELKMSNGEVARLLLVYTKNKALF